MLKNLFFIGLISLVGVFAQAQDVYKIDPDHSTFMFKVNHLGFSNTYGIFRIFSGSFTIDEANVSNSKVEIEIKTDSVDTNAPKRDEHLRKPDFFNAKQNPKITFKSTSIKKVKENVYEVKGDFNMNGVTKPLMFTLNRNKTGKDPWGNDRTGADAKFTIKRSDYNMKFMLGGVGDDVEITTSFEGIKEKK
jgi:polyisoprenoid-binding protein YceI